MAIAFDTSASVGQGYGTFQVWNHTITAGVKNPVLFVGLWHSNSDDDLLSVTYNSIAMIRISASYYERYTYLYYLENPPIGASYQVRCDFLGDDFCGGASVAYTGARQGEVQSQETNTTSGNYNISITPVRNNSWFVAYCKHGSQDPTAGTGATRRVMSANAAFFDNNAAITPPASTQMTIGNGSAGGNQICKATLAPLNLSYQFPPNFKLFT